MTTDGPNNIPTWWSARLLAVPFAVAAAIGLAIVFSTDGERVNASASSASLVKKLVGPERQSPLVLHRGRGVQIGVGRAGMLARNRGAQLALGLRDSNVGPWVRHATGATRHTSFGSEVVRFGLPASEEYLVVDRHVGKKTYSWELGAGVRPTLDGGSIHLTAGGRPLNLTLSSPRILDLAGRDVTPTGVAWKIGRDHGRWLLKLPLDDQSLPAQYVIDPVLTFRSIAVAQFNAASSATVTLPANTAAGDLLIVSLSINTTSSSAFALSPSSTSIACGGGGTQFDSTSAAAHITQNLWWAVAGAGDAGKTCVATWSGAGEVVMYVVDYTTGTYFTSHPVDFAGNGGTSASTTYTSNNLSTFFYSEFLAMAATEDANKNPGAPTPGTWTAQSATVGQTYINTSGAIKVGVVYYDGATRATAGSGTVTGTASLANNTIASVFGLRQDDATSPTVSVATPANNAKIKNGASLTSTLTDEAGGSGPQKVEYYYCVGNVTCNAGAGSPTLIGSSTTGPTYPVAWNSQPADGTYTVFAKGFDNAGNTTSSSSVVVTVDNTAPTFTSAALSGASPSANMYIGSITGLNTATASGNLYYKGNVGGGGSFKLQVGVADATSGLAFALVPGSDGHDDRLDAHGAGRTRRHRRERRRNFRQLVLVHERHDQCACRDGGSHRRVREQRHARLDDDERRYRAEWRLDHEPVGRRKRQQRPGAHRRRDGCGLRDSECFLLLLRRCCPHVQLHDRQPDADRDEHHRPELFRDLVVAAAGRELQALHRRNRQRRQLDRFELDLDLDQRRRREPAGVHIPAGRRCRWVGVRNPTGRHRRGFERKYRGGRVGLDG